MCSLPAQLPTHQPLGLLEVCPQYVCEREGCQNSLPAHGGGLRHIPPTRQALQSPLPKSILGLWKKIGAPLPFPFPEGWANLWLVGSSGLLLISLPFHFYLGGSHGGSALVSGFLGSSAEAAQLLWIHLSGRLFRPIDCCSHGAVLLEGPYV